MGTGLDALAWEIFGEGEGEGDGTSESIHRREEKRTVERARNRVCLWNEKRCTDTRNYVRLSYNDDTISQQP